MSPSGSHWNVEVITSTFNDEDVVGILSIRLSSNAQNDVLSWSGELSGQYSVHSGYRMLSSNVFPSVPMSSYYKTIWKGDCPSMVKILIWKCTWNYVPTR
ncbi:hypothetical protein V6N13_043190 [Hibiscus sabdariffa]